MFFGFLINGAFLLALIAPFTTQGRVLLMPNGEPHRLATGASALLLATLGMILPKHFVYNSGDNAYLIIAMVGIGMIVTAVPLAAATVLPNGWLRIGVGRLGVGLVLAVSAVGLLTLAWTPFMFAANDVRAEVARAHLYTMLFVVPSSSAAVLACRFLPDAKGPR